jgi:hypothetical protein
MTTSPFSAPAAFDVLPRYGLLLPLLEGRRVLEIGAAGPTGGASALYLAELGAGAVLSIDTAEAVDRAAASTDHPFVRFEATAPADLAPRAFDLVIVTDAASLVEPGAVSALAAALAPDGHLVAAFRAPGMGLLALAGEESAGAADAPLYESVVGPLAAEFASVEIFTQAPLVGWVLAAAGADEESETAADGTLAGTILPAWYLAICGAEPSGIGGLELVAAPPEPLGQIAARHLEAARARAVALQDRVAELQDQVAGLERRVAELEGALSRAEQELRTRVADPGGDRASPAAPADDGTRHASLLMRLAEAEARLAELEADAGGE